MKKIIFVLFAIILFSCSKKYNGQQKLVKLGEYLSHRLEVMDVIQEEELLMFNVEPMLIDKIMQLIGDELGIEDVKDDGIKLLEKMISNMENIDDSDVFDYYDDDNGNQYMITFYPLQGIAPKDAVGIIVAYKKR